MYIIYLGELNETLDENQFSVSWHLVSTQCFLAYFPKLSIHFPLRIKTINTLPTSEQYERKMLVTF